MDAVTATDRSQENGGRRKPLAPHGLELWRLRGATDDLRALSVETSFGHALALELDHELILLHLQPTIEVLAGYAERIHAALLQQGWQHVDTPPTERSANDTDPSRLSRFE